MTREGDYGSGIYLTVKDQDGIAVNLTDKTVKLIFKLNGVVKTKDMQVVSAPAGTVKYEWVEGDLDSDGLLEYEVVVTGPAGYHLTSERLNRLVRDVLVD